jgi:hypothetical protein
MYNTENFVPTTTTNIFNVSNAKYRYCQFLLNRMSTVINEDVADRHYGTFTVNFTELLPVIFPIYRSAIFIRREVEGEINIYFFWLIS